MVVCHLYIFFDEVSVPSFLSTVSLSYCHVVFVQRSIIVILLRIPNIMYLDQIHALYYSL
jgi:hypothetical protein